MKQFDVTYFALPGFLQRGKVGPGSRVNVLIAFDCRALSACYSRTDFYVLEIVHCAVDRDIAGYKNDSDFVLH